MHPCSKGKSVLGNFVSACVYFSFPDCQVSHSCMLSMKHRQNHEFKELAIQAKYFLFLHPSGSQNYSCFPSTTSLAQWIQKPLKSSSLPTPPYFHVVVT